jgi:hypothetical protein
MIRYMLIMDSLETYDIHLYSITTCIHAIGYEINVNTKSSMTFEKGVASYRSLIIARIY